MRAYVYICENKSMTLIASVSGIRGTIGGEVKNNLTPVDIVAFASAYGSWLTSSTNAKCTVVVGRDARISRNSRR